MAAGIRQQAARHLPGRHHACHCPRRERRRALGLGPYGGHGRPERAAEIVMPLVPRAGPGRTTVEPGRARALRTPVANPADVRDQIPHFAGVLMHKDLDFDTGSGGLAHHTPPCLYFRGSAVVAAAGSAAGLISTTSGGW